MSAPLYHDYFDLQLRFAAQYALLAGIPFTDAVARCTNLRRRFGLWGSAGEARWTGFLEQIGSCASHADRVRLAVGTHESAGHRSLSPFGCFTYDPPDAQGTLRLHFMPDERHRQASSLAESCPPDRRAELKTLFAEVRRLHPGVRQVRGLSWLYHVPAYTRLFPPRYAASVGPVTGGLNMTGSSTWGQVLDYRHRVKSGMAARVLASMGPATVDAPWLAFPLQPLSALGPVDDFFDWFA